MKNGTSVNHREIFHGFSVFVCSGYSTMTMTCIHGAVMGSRQIHVGGTNKLLQFVCILTWWFTCVLEHHVMPGSEERGAHVLQRAGDLWEVQVFIISRYRCSLHSAAWLNPCTRALCLLRHSILGKKPHQGPLNPVFNFFFLLTCSCLLWSHTMPLGFSKLWLVLNNVSVVKSLPVLTALKLQDDCS